MTGSWRKMPKKAGAGIVGAWPLMSLPELRHPAVITRYRIVPGGDI